MTYRFVTDFALLMLTALSIIQMNALATNGLIPSSGPAVEALNLGYIFIIVAVYLDLSVVFISILKDSGVPETLRTVISDA